MATKNLGIGTVLLDDELILKYSEDRVITNNRDINLKVDKVFEPVPGGLYDSNFFGSVLLDACNCRTVKRVNTYCHNCGSTPLDETTRNSRFARIEMPYLYVPYFKLKGVEDFIKTNFRIKYDFNDVDAVGGRGKLIKGLEMGQVEVSIEEDKDKPTLLIHDNFTDIDKCGYEGLIKGLTDVGLNNEASEVKKFIDKYILVLPASMRGVKITTIAGKKQLTLPKTTAIYKSIIMAKEQVLSNPQPSIKEEVIMRGVLRLYVRKALMELSEFTKSSKDNLARRMFSARVPNTFRSVITAGPELKIEEVSIPLQNAYGILKDRYLEFLMSDRNIPYFKALKIYEKGNQETLDEFESWVYKTDPVVIMVRQPTLHKLFVA